ncbi:MAG: PASTA domain-containing protein [Chloroflexi bacterium]|nr:PASTA domain-containing protein [Chloroflexota bacterium]
MPTLVGTRSDRAQRKLTRAGFGDNALINEGPAENYTIGSQSPGAGASALCSSKVTIRP